jgi:putative inorganic carbon (HCO3(-)) transporter
MSEKREKAFFIADRCAEYFLYGLLFFIPISKAAIGVFFGLAYVSFLVKKFIKPDFSFVKNYLHLFLLLFYIFCGLSLLHSAGNFKTSFIAFFFKWGKYIILFLMAEDVLRDSRRVRNCVIILLCCSAVMVVDVMNQKLLGADFFRHRPVIQTDNGLYAVTAAFQHYNDFGSYLIVVFSLAAAFLFSKGRKAVVFFASVLVVSLGVCLLMTFSRGSWLGAVCSLMLMMFLSRKYRLALSVVFLFVLAAAFNPGVRERVVFTFLPEGDADRFVVWKTTLQMIKEHPFIGKGVGLFMSHFSTYRNDLIPQYAHNCFLQIWAETGIFSLLSFITFVGIILYKGIKRIREKLDPLLLGLVCASVAFLVHSFFDTNLYSIQLATLFWFVLGLTTSRENQ